MLNLKPLAIEVDTYTEFISKQHCMSNAFKQVIKTTDYSRYKYPFLLFRTKNDMR